MINPTNPIHRAVPEVSLLVAVGNWITQYGPTFVTVGGGLLGMIYYGCLIYGWYADRRDRPKRRRTRA